MFQERVTAGYISEQTGSVCPRDPETSDLHEINRSFNYKGAQDT